MENDELLHKNKNGLMKIVSEKELEMSPEKYFKTKS